MRRVYTHFYRGCRIEIARGMVDRSIWHVWIDDVHDYGWSTKEATRRSAHRLLDNEINLMEGKTS